MTEKRFRMWLDEAIYAKTDEDEMNCDIRTFRQAGLLTNDEGLIVRLGKSTFELTIVGGDDE